MTFFLTANSVNEIVNIKQLYHSQFLKYFLTIKVAHLEAGISLCQRKYFLDLLKDSGMTVSKPCSTPIDNTLCLHQNSTEPHVDPVRTVGLKQERG